QGLEVGGGDVQVLGAYHAVDVSDGEVQAIRVLEHSGQTGGGGVGRELRGFGEPATDQLDDVVGQFGRGGQGVAGGVNGRRHDVLGVDGRHLWSLRCGSYLGVRHRTLRSFWAVLAACSG